MVLTAWNRNGFGSPLERTTWGCSVSKSAGTFLRIPQLKLKGQGRAVPEFCHTGTPRALTQDGADVLGQDPGDAPQEPLSCGGKALHVPRAKDRQQSWAEHFPWGQQNISCKQQHQLRASV